MTQGCFLLTETPIQLQFSSDVLSREYAVRHQKLVGSVVVVEFIPALKHGVFSLIFRNLLKLTPTGCLRYLRESGNRDCPAFRHGESQLPPPPRDPSSDARSPVRCSLPRLTGCWRRITSVRALRQASANRRPRRTRFLSWLVGPALV
ncbi:MAG: hypothetical protein J07HQX50_00536 [Haloquadratum sp. J07HQX50]|nr:MAG: hypothetical protein J07HQX50_00536 [Haloquadratum sp. J07HQX50]